ncbi:hypothetical protein CU098_008428, partial [Rhizopus stolonifer]
NEKQIVACGQETMADLNVDFHMGEPSEKYEEILAGYFRKERKEDNMLCLTALLEFLHFSFAKDYYN